MQAVTAPRRVENEPPRGRRTPRLALAATLGHLASSLSRTLGVGAGSTIGGRVVLAVDPTALRQLGVGHRTVLVSGTNGKSTTTRLITAALGTPVATNTTGANMPAGLVSALLDVDAREAVLETDELFLPRVLADTRPEAVVLLNLSRDQLDRMHEVSRVSARWHAALAAHPPRLVVANADDPQVVAAARDSATVWVRPPASGWSRDSLVCPLCGDLLTREGASWSCGCGFAPPSPEVVVDGDRVRLPDGQWVRVPLALPGLVNRGNAAFALAAATALGIDPSAAAARLGTVHEVEGRYARVLLGGRPVRLLLAKNPAGWASALQMIGDDDKLVVGVNARAADGRDTSWLWDVPFETLAGRPVGVLGEHAADVALRLTYAGARPVRAATPEQLMRRMPDGELTVLANYTAFQDVRRRAA